MNSPENRTIVLDMSETHDVRLHAALTALLGRRVTNEQIWNALGISKARYYQLAKEDGAQLVRADRLIDVARHLDINPVELLVQFSDLTARDAQQFVNKRYEGLEELQTDKRPFAVATMERRPRLASLTQRQDAPPL